MLYGPWYIAFVFNRVAYYVFVLRCTNKYIQYNTIIITIITLGDWRIVL